MSRVGADCYFALLVLFVLFWNLIHLVYFTLDRLIQRCEIIAYYLLSGVDWRENFPQKFSYYWDEQTF